MALIPQYETSNVEEILAKAGGSNVLIPDDFYKAIIVASELKKTSKGGQGINFTYVITEGPHRDTELKEFVNIVNDNPTAVKIGYETIARIAKAVGLESIPQKTEDLHGKPFCIKTKTEKQADWVNNEGVTVEGKDRSVINSREYKAIPKVSQDIPFDSVDSTSDSPVTGKMPWDN